VNVEKTEYIVFNGNERDDTTLHLGQGRLVKADKATTYLGYKRRNTESSVQHLKARIEKAKKACLAVQSTLHRLKHLPTHRKVIIANACIRSTFLYGTEACCDDDLRLLKHEMNVIMRRVARQILGTSYAPVN